MVRFCLTQRGLVLGMHSLNSKYFCQTYSSFFDSTLNTFYQIKEIIFVDCPEETVLTVRDKYKVIFLYPGIYTILDNPLVVKLNILYLINNCEYCSHLKNIFF